MFKDWDREYKKVMATPEADAKQEADKERLKVGITAEENKKDIEKKFGKKHIQKGDVEKMKLERKPAITKITNKEELEKLRSEVAIPERSTFKKSMEKIKKPTDTSTKEGTSNATSDQKETKHPEREILRSPFIDNFHKAGSTKIEFVPRNKPEPKESFGGNHAESMLYVTLKSLNARGFDSSEALKKLESGKLDMESFWLVAANIMSTTIDRMGTSNFSDSAIWQELQNAARDMYNAELLYPAPNDTFNHDEHEWASYRRSSGSDAKIGRVEKLGIKSNGYAIHKAQVSM